MDPMSGCDIRLVFTFPPKDSTLQCKKCVHLWNNFPCISTLGKVKSCARLIFRYFMVINGRKEVGWQQNIFKFIWWGGREGREGRERRLGRKVGWINYCMGRLFFILSLLILDSLNQAPLTKGVSMLIVFIQFQERLVEEIDFFHKLKFSNPHNFVKFLTFYIMWLIILLEFIFETSKIYKIGTW